MREVESIGHLVTPSVQTQAVVHGGTGAAKGKILPVVIGHIAIEIQILKVPEEGVVISERIVSLQCCQLILPGCIIVWREYIECFGDFFYAEIGIITESQFACFSRFGGYDDYAIGAT